MTYYPPVLLVDAFRLAGDTHAVAKQNIIGHYREGAGGWNHMRSATFLRAGYGGVFDVVKLTAACRGDGRSPAYVDNAKIVEAAGPNVVNRDVQCFDFPRRSYAITPTLLCPFGPTLFIVESGVIKVVYFHARNEKRAELSHLAGWSCVMEEDILQNDFFGQPSDIELHLVNKKGSARDDDVFNLSRIKRHLAEDPHQTLRRFALAFREVDEGRLAGEIVKDKRRTKRPSSEQLELKV